MSMLALLQGGWSLQPAPLVIFLTLSLAVLVSYWIWCLYVNIIATNYPVFEEQVEILDIVTLWLLANHSPSCVSMGAGHPTSCVSMGAGHLCKVSIITLATPLPSPIRISLIKLLSLAYRAFTK